MDDYPNFKEVMELAALRIKNRKEYEDLMGSIFSVYSDFVVFDKEFETVVEKIEKSRAEGEEMKK